MPRYDPNPGLVVRRRGLPRSVVPRSQRVPADDAPQVPREDAAGQPIERRNIQNLLDSGELQRIVRAGGRVLISFLKRRGGGRRTVEPQWPAPPFTSKTGVPSSWLHNAAGYGLFGPFFDRTVGDWRLLPKANVFDIKAEDAEGNRRTIRRFIGQKIQKPDEYAGDAVNPEGRVRSDRYYPRGHGPLDEPRPQRLVDLDADAGNRPPPDTTGTLAGTRRVAGGGRSTGRTGRTGTTGSTGSPGTRGGRQFAEEPGEPEEPGSPVGIVAAGMAVIARDTGRVLMLQRDLQDDNADAAGTWEFPGGGIEPRETAKKAARREWQEETGCQLPKGRFVGEWRASNGRYRGFVYLVRRESDVCIHDGRDAVTNPDDPDGDRIESVAWWNPDHMRRNPALRKELRTDMRRVLSALNGAGVSPRGTHFADVAMPGMSLTAPTGMIGGGGQDFGVEDTLARLRGRAEAIEFPDIHEPADVFDGSPSLLPLLQELRIRGAQDNRNQRALEARGGQPRINQLLRGNPAQRRPLGEQIFAVEENPDPDERIRRMLDQLQVPATGRQDFGIGRRIQRGVDRVTAPVRSELGPQGRSRLTGATAGAAAGSLLGPLGMVAGGAAGALLGGKRVGQIGSHISRGAGWLAGKAAGTARSVAGHIGRGVGEAHQNLRDAGVLSQPKTQMVGRKPRVSPQMVAPPGPRRDQEFAAKPSKPKIPLPSKPMGPVLDALGETAPGQGQGTRALVRLPIKRQQEFAGGVPSASRPLRTGPLGRHAIHELAGDARVNPAGPRHVPPDFVEAMIRATPSKRSRAKWPAPGRDSVIDSLLGRGPQQHFAPGDSSRERFPTASWNPPRAGRQAAIEALLREMSTRDLHRTPEAGQLQMVLRQLAGAGATGPTQNVNMPGHRPGPRETPQGRISGAAAQQLDAWLAGRKRLADSHRASRARRNREAPAPVERGRNLPAPPSPVADPSLLPTPREAAILGAKLRLGTPPGDFPGGFTPPGYATQDPRELLAAIGHGQNVPRPAPPPGRNRPAPPSPAIRVSAKAHRLPLERPGGAVLSGLQANRELARLVSMVQPASSATPRLAPGSDQPAYRRSMPKPAAATAVVDRPRVEPGGMKVSGTVQRRPGKHVPLGDIAGGLHEDLGQLHPEEHAARINATAGARAGSEGGPVPLSKRQANIWLKQAKGQGSGSLDQRLQGASVKEQRLVDRGRLPRRRFSADREAPATRSVAVHLFAGA